MNKNKILYNLGAVESIILANVKDNDTCDTGVNHVHEIENELNSKVKMPKVFDDWASNYDVGTTAGLDYALTDIFNAYMGSRYEFSDLDDWFRDGSDADEKKYSDCVDALCNGYEVE